MNNIYDLAGNLFEITYQFIGASSVVSPESIEYQGVKVILGGCYSTSFNGNSYNLVARKQQGSHAAQSSYYPLTGVRTAFNLR